MSRFFERRFLFRSAASVILLALLLWRVDLSAAGHALRDANYVYVIPALLLFGVAKLLVAQRWRIMMSKFADLPLAPLFGILLVSNLANNIVPARIGDLIRVQVPAQRYGTSRARVAATVFATESLLDGITFAVLGLIGLALIDLPNFPTGIFWGVLGLVAGGLIAVIPLSHLKLEPGWQRKGVLARLPDAGAGLDRGRRCHTSIDGLVVFKDLRLGAQAIGLSFALWLIEVGMFALFGLAFGIHLSMPAWMLIMVSANMISSRADHAVEHRRVRGGADGAVEGTRRRCGHRRWVRDRVARIEHPLDHGGGLHRYVGAEAFARRRVLLRAAKAGDRARR